MDISNKKWFGILLGLVFVAVFYFTRYGSIKGKVTLGLILAIVCLVKGIGALFFSKSKVGAIFFFLVFLWIVFNIISQNVDFNDAKIHYLMSSIFMVLGPPFFVLILLIANKYNMTKYKYSSKDLKVRRQRLTKFIIIAPVFELMIFCKLISVLIK